MSKPQFAIMSGAYALVLCVAAILAVVIMSENSALIGVALLGLAILSIGTLSAGLLGFGLLLHRRTTALTRRRIRRSTPLGDVHSYS